MFFVNNNKKTLRSQITLSALGLILITVIGMVSSFWIVISDFTNIQNERRIVNTQRVLNQYLAEKDKLLITAARVLTADFGFKQAVATRDQATIEDVLSNHGKRIEADLMVLIDLNGQLITTSEFRGASEENQFQQLISNQTINSNSQFITVDGDIFQVMLLPVDAPRTIAYVIIGFAFNNQSLSELKRLTGLDISIFSEQEIIVSSLESVSVAYQHLIQSYDVIGTFWDLPKYQYHKFPFSSSDSLNVLLSSSLQEENSELYRLVVSILVVASIIALLTFIFSALLSRSITKPLHELVNYTKEIGSGIFRQKTRLDAQSAEVRELHSAFVKMNQALESREKEIVFRAEHDVLTQLPNRQSVIRQLDEWCSDKSFFVVIMSILNFRELNDSMGPEIGDQVMSKFSERLREYCSKMTMLTAPGRISDNNFVYSQVHETAEESTSYINDLLSYLSTPYLIEQFSIELDLSAGILKIPEEGTGAGTILRRLMLVSRNAKSHQSRLANYRSGLDDDYLRKINLLDELRDNLQREKPSLFMVYQPKLNLITNDVYKVEALIRWINDAGDFINPEEFISLAENSGLIVSLTRWIIKTVIVELAEIEKHDLILEASINVSAMDVLHEGFIEHLVEQTQANNITPDRITIELTERDLAESEEHLLQRINNLKSLGFKISVDDYGIGQSSLSKLKTLPVDELKIDKSFILQLDSSPSDQTIVRSTITLGHELKMSVVAEGVENQASLDLLRSFNCDLIQGYHIAKPQKLTDLIDWYNDVKTTH